MSQACNISASSERQILANFFKPVPKSQVSKKPPSEAPKSLYFHTNWSTRLMKTAVLLRFGTFNRPAKTVMGIRRIASRIGKSESSLQRKLKHYEITGQFSQSQNLKRGKSRMYPELEKALCRREILQEWSPFSLQQRVTLVQKRFGVKVSHSYLYQVYKRANIGYRKLVEVKRQAWKRRFELDLERQKFAVKFAKIIVSGDPIILQDESSCGVWSTKQKSWSLPGCPNYNVVNQVRHSWNIFGAIGSGLKKSLFSCQESVSKESFHQFLLELIPLINDRKVKPYLLMDNHRSHYAIMNREILSQHFRVLFIPPYSCQFNAIERVWGVAKVKIRVKLMNLEKEIDKEQFKEMILETFAEIGERKMTELAKSNRKFIYEQLTSY